MSASTAGTSRRRWRRRRTRAQQADKYDLYQRSVQDVEGDVRRMRRFYESRVGRSPRTLREDFCGTAALACEWVRAHGENRAFGVDLDPEPLAWGRRTNLSTLSPDQAMRIRLIEGDVRSVRHERVDLCVAFNFSFFLFKQRDELRHYFRKARARLAPEGLFVLDAYGGPEAQERREEKQQLDGFVYVWDQDRFDAVTGDTTCFIHFEFRDGSRLRRVFRYDWRLWSLPELQEILLEAGFASVDIYWEGTDLETGDANGVFRRVRHAAEDPAWIAYIVANQ